MNNQEQLKKHLLKVYQFSQQPTQHPVTIDMIQFRCNLSFKPYANEIVKVIFEATGISRVKHEFKDGRTELVWYKAPKKTPNS